MRKFIYGLAAVALASGAATVEARDTKGSSARQQQTRETVEIPRCGRRLGDFAWQRGGGVGHAQPPQRRKAHGAQHGRPPLRRRLRAHSAFLITIASSRPPAAG